MEEEDMAVKHQMIQKEWRINNDWNCIAIIKLKAFSYYVQVVLFVSYLISHFKKKKFKSKVSEKALLTFPKNFQLQYYLRTDISSNRWPWWTFRWYLNCKKFYFQRKIALMLQKCGVHCLSFLVEEIRAEK